MSFRTRDPFLAVRASLRRWSSDEFEGGLTHGRQGWFRRRPADSFFPPCCFEPAMLKESVGDHRHERVVMQAVPSIASYSQFVSHRRRIWRRGRLGWRRGAPRSTLSSASCTVAQQCCNGENQWGAVRLLAELGNKRQHHGRAACERRSNSKNYSYNCRCFLAFRC